MENLIITKLFGEKQPKQPQTINIKANEAVILSNSVQNVIEVEAEVLDAEIIPDNPFLWDIEERPVYNGNGQVINGYKSIIRSDNHLVLNVCKNSYTPTSNETLYNTALELVHISGMTIESVKEFKGGAVVAVALYDSNILEIGGYSYKNRLIIGNSHNSQHTFFVGLLSTMLRCDNQFSKISSKLKAYHTVTNLQQIDNIIRYYKEYQNINNVIRKFLERAELLKMSHKQMLEAAQLIFNIQPEAAEKSKLFQNFKSSLDRETKALGFNGLGFFNGITHFTTHVRESKERLYSNVFGSNADTVNRTFNYLNSL